MINMRQGHMLVRPFKYFNSDESFRDLTEMFVD